MNPHTARDASDDPSCHGRSILQKNRETGFFYLQGDESLLIMITIYLKRLHLTTRIPGVVTHGSTGS